jgi:hypothetical protein
MEAALDDIRVGSFAAPRRSIGSDTSAAGLPDLEIDVEIRDEHGRLLGIADGVYARYGVIVEIEATTGRAAGSGTATSTGSPRSPPKVGK